MSEQKVDQLFYTHVSNSKNKEYPFVTLASSTLPLELRTPTPEDVPALVALLSNPANTQDDLSVSQKTPAEMDDMISGWVTISEPLERLNFLVLASGVPVGCSGIGWIGLAKKDDESSERAGAAGIMLDPDARGKGYAYEALKMSIDYGLRELGLVEVRIGTPSSNAAMRGLMEKKFHMPAEVVEPDRFGNDLVWRIWKEDWL
jgi:RimJ/RimL family protein N-acetyltransferase